MDGRKRNRLQGFDYSKDAVYFFTICTKDKIHYFGNIHNQIMDLNELGKIAESQVLWLNKQYSYFELHNFVVMPNHIHLLFGINRHYSKENFDEIAAEFTINRDLSVEFQPKIKTVSSLIGAYKTTSSKKIHEFGNLEFSWQRSFHDHIVRSQHRYDVIFNYITENPSNWDKDKFYE